MTEICFLFFQLMRIVFLGIARDNINGAEYSTVVDITEVSPNRHSEVIGMLQLKRVEIVLMTSFQNKVTGGHDHIACKYVSGVLSTQCVHLSDSAIPILNSFC